MIIRSYMGVTGKQRKHMREIAETEQNNRILLLLLGEREELRMNPSFQACIIESMINAIN